MDYEVEVFDVRELEICLKFVEAPMPDYISPFVFFSILDIDGL